MDWKSVGSKLADVAPWLGASLGGPAGAAVGSLLATTLGTGNDPSKVMDAISVGNELNANAVVEIRRLEANMEVELQKMALQREMGFLDDTKSARELAAKQPGDKVRPAITFTLLFGVMFVVVAIFGGTAKEVLMDPTAAATIGIVVGFLFGELKQALSFYFGTSNSDLSTKITDAIKTKASK